MSAQQLPRVELGRGDQTLIIRTRRKAREFVSQLTPGMLHSLHRAGSRNPKILQVLELAGVIKR
jgi:hypothetical protein